MIDLDLPWDWIPLVPSRHHGDQLAGQSRGGASQ